MKKICPKCKKNKKVILNNKMWGYCRKCHNENSKISVKKSNKKNNYRLEKTDWERKRRYIKRRTRTIYPLGKQRCKYCKNIATEHHHTTDPPKIHDFDYVCHNCHVKKHKSLD